jgi:hypothetical protein
MMLKSWIHKQIGKLESGYGYDAGYLHGIVDVSTVAAIKFRLFQRFAHHHDQMPRDLGFAARIAATIGEDCGPCAQLSVDMALKAGVPAAMIAALLRGDLAAAGDEAALGFRYGAAIAGHSPDVVMLAEEIERHYGKRALVSLAFNVAGVRVYPALKRGLGYGATCTRIQVAEHSIAIAKAA